MHFCIMCQCVFVCVSVSVCQGAAETSNKFTREFCGLTKKEQPGSGAKRACRPYMQIARIALSWIVTHFPSEMLRHASPPSLFPLRIEGATATSKLTAPLCAGEAKPQTHTHTHTRTHSQRVTPTMTFAAAASRCNTHTPRARAACMNISAANIAHQMARNC